MGDSIKQMEALRESYSLDSDLEVAKWCPARLQQLNSETVPESPPPQIGVEDCTASEIQTVSPEQVVATDQVELSQATDGGVKSSANASKLRPSPGPFPPELWRLILLRNELALEDLKNVRLTCKVLAEIVLEELFKTLVFRRGRGDYLRFLTMLSEGKEQFVHDIRALRFDDGLIDPNNMGTNLAMTDWTMKRGKKFSGERRSDLVDEYMEWYHGVMKNRDSDPISSYDLCARTLAEILRKLKNVERIDISNKACPLKAPELMGAWRRGNRSTHFEHTINRTWRTLRAIQGLGWPDDEGVPDDGLPALKHLTHDEFPVAFFDPCAEEGRVLKAFAEVTKFFVHLETLHLNFEATEAPIKVFWKILAECVTRAEKLRDLRLGFDPVFKTCKIDRADSREPYKSQGSWNEVSDAHFERHYAPLHLLFETQNIWKNLVSFRLDGLVLCAHGLEHVLLSHLCIRKVYLCQIALLHGTWGTLLWKIRKGMRLEHFEIWGDIMSVHGDAENWALPPPWQFWKSMANHEGPGIQLFGDTWKRHMTYSYPDQDLRIQARDRLQDYTLRRGEWPGALLERISLPMKFSSHQEARTHKHCSLDDGVCKQDLDRIASMWSDPNGDLQEALWWELDECEYEYNSKNVDIFLLFDDGYDIHGFDDNGTHHSNDLPENSLLVTARTLVDEMSSKFAELKRKDDKGESEELFDEAIFDEESEQSKEDDVE
ncbi:hypothetical protein BDZ45DRAFT_786019 [Acephala macrosclerotiorum]|nr:hypothetical protein BDZ45DRAFT_786019 [Acephala macrosclerotiorum]